MNKNIIVKGVNKMNLEVTVDLDEVKSFIESPDFHQYLLAHTPSFETAAFVLQALLDAVESAATTLDNA
jgi:hypothetical protein